MTRVAETKAGVVRLAPVAGFYWLKLPRSDNPAYSDYVPRWHVVELIALGRAWYGVDGDSYAEGWTDGRLVGAEIVGPIPEPPEDE